MGLEGKKMVEEVGKMDEDKKQRGNKWKRKNMDDERMVGKKMVEKGKKWMKRNKYGTKLDRDRRAEEK